MCVGGSAAENPACFVECELEGTCRGLRRRNSLAAISHRKTFSGGVLLVTVARRRAISRAILRGGFK
jgi:hypothetical protein